MINTVIFDLDGLLVDTEILSYKAYQQYLSKVGYDLSLKDYCKYFCGKTEEQADREMIERYHLDISLKELVDYLSKQQQDLVDQGVELKKGARELLMYLKENGYKIVLATSSFKDRAIAVLRQHGIDHLFDEFVTAADVSHSKPNKEVFEKAATKVNSKARECLVLEDSEAGIMAANNAGIKVICVVDMKAPSEKIAEKCLQVYDSLFDVLDYLKDNNK